MSSCETTNSVFNVTDENNSFSIAIPGHLNSKSAGKTIDELNKLLELRSENDIELHMQQFEKRGKKLEMLGPDPKINVVLIGAEMFFQMILILVKMKYFQIWIE